MKSTNRFWTKLAAKRSLCVKLESVCKRFRFISLCFTFNQTQTVILNLLCIKTSKYQKCENAKKKKKVSAANYDAFYIISLLACSKDQIVTSI